MKRIRTTEIYFELEESNCISFRTATTGTFCPHCGAVIGPNSVSHELMPAQPDSPEANEAVIEVNHSIESN